MTQRKGIAASVPHMVQRLALPDASNATVDWILQVCQVYEPETPLAPEVVDKYTPPALVAYVYPSVEAGPAAEDVEEVRIAVR